MIFITCVLFPALTFAKTVTLNIHCWEGYTKPYEEGFVRYIKEKENVYVVLNITNVSDPDEFWQVARSQQADLISPAHNIPKSNKWPFIQNKMAAPVDLAHVPNYKYLLPFLKKSKFVTEGGAVYGVPYTMGPYGLAYNADFVKEPTSWDVLWEPSAKKKYTISKDYSDANIYVTALTLGASYADLYDSNTLVKKVEKKSLQSKLSYLAENAYSLWEGTADPREFNELHYAATWGYAVASANKRGLNWKMARPKEGTTMWVDHWVMTRGVLADPLKKKIAELWMNYCLSVDLQVGVIRNWGVSPVVTNLGDAITPLERETFAVGDLAYWQNLSLWDHQDIRTVNTNALLWEHAVQKRKRK